MTSQMFISRMQCQLEFPKFGAAKILLRFCYGMRIDDVRSIRTYLKLQPPEAPLAKTGNFLATVISMYVKPPL